MADSLKADSLKADSWKAGSLKADSLKAYSLKAVEHNPNGLALSNNLNVNRLIDYITIHNWPLQPFRRRRNIFSHFRFNVYPRGPHV